VRPRTLLWLALVTLALGASLARAGGAAIFTKQTQNTGNTFTTPSCFPGDTGLLKPSAEAADTGGDGNGFEVDPTNAYEDDSSFAVNVDGAGDQHRYYNYGVSIPSGCSIKGIEVRLDWWLDSTEGANSMSVELWWNGGTSWTVAKTDTEETTLEHTATLGSSTDTWGYAWTVDDLTNANFRVRLTSNSDSGDRDFFLDWVPVKIYYGGAQGGGYGGAYAATPATSTPTPSATPTPTPIGSPSPIATPTFTVIPSPTTTPTATPAAMPSPTATPAPTPAITPTTFSYPFAIPTPTPFSYPFAVPTPTPAAKATPTAPLTATPTPAASCTDMSTPTVTPTPTATPTPS